MNKIKNPEQKIGVNFKSEKNAKDFAQKTQGQIKDVRNKGKGNANFKVTFIKKNHPRFRKGYVPKDTFDTDYFDFDHAINGKGTNWHTAEDL